MRESQQCPVCRADFGNGASSSAEALQADDAEDGELDSSVDFVFYFSEEGRPLPPPPLMQPPTAENIIQCLRAGNVTEVENMIAHDRRLARISDGDGDTLLHLAVVAHNEYLLRYLSQHGGVSINATNRARMTPLHYAVFAQNTRMVALVLQLGGFVDAGDASGKTPLMYAAINCQADDLALLLRDNASVGAADLVGDTALHHAVRSRSLPSVRALSTFPYFDVNASNCLGETALHIACARGFSECVAFLSVCGANPAQKNKAGRLPCQRSPALPALSLP